MQNFTGAFEENYIEESITILTASLNEVQNIGKWINEVLEIRAKMHLTPITEIVIVDDGSKDGTQDKILAIAEKSPIEIKLVQRHSKLGTLNAQITGAINSSSNYILVMDCDLQHPIEYIPHFLAQMKNKPDIVIGSRYIEGGANRWSPYRGIVSRTATFLSHVLLKNSRNVSDPLSGYFLIKRALLRSLKPYSGMYKPLLFAISSYTDLHTIEIPITMENRMEGESKIVNNPMRVILSYIREILVFWKNSRKFSISELSFEFSDSPD